MNLFSLLNKFITLAITKHGRHTHAQQKHMLIIWQSASPSAKGREKLVPPTSQTKMWPFAAVGSGLLLAFLGGKLMILYPPSLCYIGNGNMDQGIYKVHPP